MNSLRPLLGDLKAIGVVGAVTIAATGARLLAQRASAVERVKIALPKPLKFLAQPRPIQPFTPGLCHCLLQMLIFTESTSLVVPNISR